MQMRRHERTSHNLIQESGMWWIVSMVPLILVGVGAVIILVISLVDHSESSTLRSTATLECYHCGQQTSATKRTCQHCGGELQ